MSKILKGIQEAPQKDFDAHQMLGRGIDIMTPAKFTIADGTGRYVGDIYDSYVEAEKELSKFKKKYLQAKIVELPKKVNEDLRKWFKEKWVRFNPQGKIMGPCARGDDSEGKPKCLPQAKAHALGKKGRKYAAAKKRREDPNPERSGKAINVATKKKSNEGMAENFGEPFSDQRLAYVLQQMRSKDKDSDMAKTAAGLSHNKGSKNIDQDEKSKDLYDPYDPYSSNPAGIYKEDVAEEQLDELKCWPGYTRVQGVPAGAPGSCKKKTSEGVLEGEGEKMSKTRALNALRKQLMNEYPYMKCANLEEFKQRLQWLSEGMLKNHMTNEKNYKINTEEIALYQEYRKKREQIQQGLQGVTEEKCPHCAGPLFSEELMMEKKDACYYKVKSRYKVWPSAYASGALVKCRKKGAKNWGTKSESAIMQGIQTDKK